jgi:hypothetical protein
MLLKACTTTPLTDGFITVANALEHAQALPDVPMSRPDLFGAQQVNAFQDAERALTHVSSAGICGRRQFWASLSSLSVNTVGESILLWCHAALCLSNVLGHSTHKFQLSLVLRTTSQTQVRSKPLGAPSRPDETESDHPVLGLIRSKRQGARLCKGDRINQSSLHWQTKHVADLCMCGHVRTSTSTSCMHKQ